MRWSSSRVRALTALVASSGAIALVLAWAPAIEAHPVGMTVCIGEGRAADGRFEVVSLARVVATSEEGYRVRKGREEILVTTRARPLPPLGAEITIGGRCADAGARFEEQWSELHPGVKGKMAIGIATSIFLLCMTFVWFGAGRGGLRIRG